MLPSKPYLKTYPSTSCQPTRVTPLWTYLPLRTVWPQQGDQNSVDWHLQTPTKKPHPGHWMPDQQQAPVSPSVSSQAISTPSYCHHKTSASPCPRFFRLTQDSRWHNPDVPLRPIVALRVSTTYNEARHLTKILCPILGLKQNHISNLSQYFLVPSKWSLLIKSVLQNC